MTSPSSVSPHLTDGETEAQGAGVLGETRTASEPEQVLALSASETKASLLGVVLESSLN